MIEKHKKNFSELLSKIDEIDMDRSSSFTNDFDEICKNIENSYGKIQRSLANKLEDLNIVSNIFYRSSHTDETARHGGASLSSVADKAIDKINNFTFFEMIEKLIPFNLKKGNWLFDQGRVEEALDAWEAVLKVNPDNEYVHSKLSRMINGYEADAKDQDCCSR